MESFFSHRQWIMDTFYELQTLSEYSQLSARVWSSLWTLEKGLHWGPGKHTKVSMLHKVPWSLPFGLPGPQSAHLSFAQSGNVSSNDDCCTILFFVLGTVIGIVLCFIVTVLLWGRQDYLYLTKEGNCTYCPQEGAGFGVRFMWT